MEQTNQAYLGPVSYTHLAADSKNTKQYNSTITQSGSAQRVTVEAKDRAGNTQTCLLYTSSMSVYHFRG